MKLISRITLTRLAAMACVAAAGAAHADPFAYTTNFSAGVGPEWNINTTYNNGDAGILGQLQDGSATLNLLAGGPGTSSLAFDLLGFRTVDAVNCCTDTFRLSINGNLVLQGNFDMGGGGLEQVTVNTLGASVTGSGPSRQIAISTFALASGANTITFDYGAMQGFGDEAWGLDNVALSGSVTPAVPEPGTWALMLAGLAGAGAVVRRRR